MDGTSCLSRKMDHVQIYRSCAHYVVVKIGHKDLPNFKSYLSMSTFQGSYRESESYSVFFFITSDSPNAY